MIDYNQLLEEARAVGLSGDDVLECASDVAILCLESGCDPIAEVRKWKGRKTAYAIREACTVYSHSEIDENGETKEWLLNNAAVLKAQIDQEPDDFQFTEGLSDLIATIKVTGDTREWVKEVYKTKLRILQKLSKRRDKRTSNILTRNSTFLTQ